MFAPCLRSLARPASNRAPQCLRRPRLEAIPKQRITFQIRQQRYQSNYQSNPSTRTNFKRLFKAHPFQMSLAMFCIAGGVGGLVYANYFYQSYIIGAFQVYPEPVAKQMRKALYYTNMDLQPKNALKYYQEALRVADQVGMDPFSDEIIGIRIQVAALMEKIQQYQKAIDVLEIVKNDNMQWVDLFGDKVGNEGKRTRVLKKTVGVSVKLGELYSNEYVKEMDKAEESLGWAVEMQLKELKRREKEGTREGEGEWMSPEEIGGALEALGHHYEEKDMHYLAAPLFLQALTMSPTSSCHTVVLMNNLSISLAQQSPPAVPGQPPVSREALVSNAQAWAEKALAVAAKIIPPERTEECDLGCAVAIHNLGEFAEMNGDIRGARKRFEEAKSIAKAIGFEAGVINSEEGLRRLGKKP